MPYAHDLTEQTLKELRAPRPYPAVTVALPTHRRLPDNAQDATRLRNLLARAKKELADDPAVDKAVRADVEAQLDAAAGELDLAHATEGTVLLAAPGEHHLWQLPTPVPERVVLADTFLTRHLLASHLQQAPYWALVITEGTSRLLHGSGNTLVEVLDHGFPAVPQIPDHEDAQPGPNFGNHPSPHRAERERQYLRAIDEHLTQALRTAPAPVHLIALDSVIAAFQAVTRNTRHLAQSLGRGGADGMPVHELARLLAPVRQEHVRQSQGEALDKLRAALGERRFAAGMGEVWQVVHEGRAGLLLVEDGFQVTGSIDGDRLDLTDSRARAQDDVVDSLVEKALDTGADVILVPDGALADHDRIATVLRY